LALVDFVQSLVAVDVLAPLAQAAFLEPQGGVEWLVGLLVERLLDLLEGEGVNSLVGIRLLLLHSILVLL
jgi:hypothetical protein